MKEPRLSAYDQRIKDENDAWNAIINRLIELKVFTVEELNQKFLDPAPNNEAMKFIELLATWAHAFGRRYYKVYG